GEQRYDTIKVRIWFRYRGEALRHRTVIIKSRLHEAQKENVIAIHRLWAVSADRADLQDALLRTKRTIRMRNLAVMLTVRSLFRRELYLLAFNEVSLLIITSILYDLESSVE
ncbi:hypothetical protein Tcan_00308, partial [Toxocara canis]